MRHEGWVERYRKGDRERVWSELERLGPAVRDPNVLPEAQAVCDEMALRARFNIQLIVKRLQSQDFMFHSNDDERTPVVPFRPASVAAPQLVAWLEAEFGPVPLVLSSWLRIVGDVWLVGTHPHWSESSGWDPLVIELEGTRYPGLSISNFFVSEYEAWIEEAAQDSADGSFVLPVAPDRLHKANVSGGVPYGFRIPDGGVDAVFVAEGDMPFVSYLNLIFDNGGFGAWPSGVEEQRLRKSLTDGLLAL
jgi:hypothetical protein